MKRIVINKPRNIKCEICEKEISLYGFPSHLINVHNLKSTDYVNKFGEFRAPKRSQSIRNIQKITCGICNDIFSSVGMFVHLRDTHNLNPDEYTVNHDEYRPSKLREKSYIDRLKQVSDREKQICVICKQEFASGNLLGGHIKSAHLLSKKDYILNHVFNGIRPICECGCGRKVKLLNYYPYKVDYIFGHNNDGETNPMFGRHHSIETKKKMSIKAIERIKGGIGKTIDTEPELRFKAILDKFNIEYKHPYIINLGNRYASVDFYLPEKNLLIEIDGEYWHPDKLENLNFHILPNVISDKQKENVSNMIHLRENNIKTFEKYSTSKDLVFDFLLYSSKPYNQKINYKQKIINKEYFKICLDKKGKNYLKSYSWLLLKFLRTFQLTFPYPNLEENLEEIINKINKADLTKAYNPLSKEFSNNISVVGHNYLKYFFHSYWKSKFNGNKSPEETWLDDKIMKEVIEYRIGCNDSNEIFNFSLHQMVRGLSARRITISFFKPLLSAVIYFKFLGNKENPVVLDPCCGFGGRLIGIQIKIS